MVVLNRDRAGRTYRRALAAVHTVRIRDVLIERRGDHHLRTSVRKIDHTDILYLMAHTHTVAAEYTFAGISHDRLRGGIVDPVVIIIRETDLRNAKTMRQLLQTAASVLLTDGTVSAVGSQQQLQNHLAMLVKLRRIRINYGAILRRRRAGRQDMPLLILHHTHPAGAVSGKIRIVTESRQDNTGFQDDSQHGLLIRKFDAVSVDHHIFFHVSHILSSPALPHGTCILPYMRRT